MSEIDDLRARERAIDEEVHVLRNEQHDVRARMDEIALAARPKFPTKDQKAGIRRAAELIRQRVTPSSHHGDPVRPGSSVSVDGARGWISVHHSAPYAKLGISKLWRFTDEESEALLDLVRATGLEVTQWWRHGEGISIIAVVPR